MKNEYQKQTLQKKDKLKWINYILMVLFFSGLILTIFEIDIFRKTVIDWKIPMGIGFGIGFISMLWLRKYLSEYQTKNIFLQLVFSVCSFGGIFTYGFMATNYYLLAKNEGEMIKATIIESGYLAQGQYGCENPYAYIYIKGTEKQLIFPCGFEIEKYKFVTVKLQRGFFGFDRIIDQVAENE